LPDTTWQPIDPSAPVVIAEQSVIMVDTFVLPNLGSATFVETMDCAPTGPATVVTLDPGASTTTTLACDRPGNGFGDRNHTHCGAPGAPHPRRPGL
jgi:hypothetical protein